MLDPWHLAAIGGAGFLAGAVNAVAGGGSLISFPALLAAGYPPVTANVTNAVAVLPGYAGGSLGYRRELTGQGERVRRFGAASALGALGGSALLLASSDAVFRAIVPLLVLGSCALLAAQPLIVRALGGARQQATHGRGALALQFGVAIYGGYFGAGLGILMLAALGILIDDDLQRLNALKGMLSLVVGVVSTLFFGLFGPVVWSAAAGMAVASLLGGQVGVHVARRLPAAALRWLVVGFGVVVAILLMVRS